MRNVAAFAPKEYTDTLSTKTLVARSLKHEEIKLCGSSSSYFLILEVPDSPACVVMIMLQHGVAKKTRLRSAEH